MDAPTTPPVEDVRIPGHIYALIEREFIRSGENVVKVGRAMSALRRIPQYPKGSRLLFCMYCDDLVGTEAELLRLLDVAFVRRTDIGRESFEGDLNAIVAFVSQYVTAKLLAGPPARPAAMVDRGSDASTDVVATIVGTEGVAEAVPEVVEEAPVVTEWAPVVVETVPEVDETVSAVVEEVPPVVVPIPKEAVIPDVAIVRFVEENKAALDNAREITTVMYGRFASFCDSMNWKVPVNHVRFSKLLVEIYNAQSVVVRNGMDVERYMQMPRLIQVERDPTSSAVDTVASWCEDTLKVTGRSEDFVLLDDLKKSFVGGSGMTNVKFAGLVNSYFKGVERVTFVGRSTVPGTRMTSRNILKGVILNRDV